MLALAFGELTTSHIRHYSFPHRSIFVRDIGFYVFGVHMHGLILTTFVLVFRSIIRLSVPFLLSLASGSLFRPLSFSRNPHRAFSRVDRPATVLESNYFTYFR